MFYCQQYNPSGKSLQMKVKLPQQGNKCNRENKMALADKLIKILILHHVEWDCTRTAVAQFWVNVRVYKCR